MHIRKGLSTDLARLECCDFSFTVDEIAREPFLNGDLHIEALTDPYHKTYELDLQTLENHCVNPDSIFLIAETDDGEIA
ncbi:N-acetyltransferase, partial [Enterobacter hormaechei]